MKYNLIVGGMPAPVWSYIQTNNLQNVAVEQSAIILCNDNVSVSDKKIYLPIYMTTFIRKKKEIPGVYKLEL